MTIVRVLGVDPGIGITGFGVLDVQRHQITAVASGAIQTSSSDSQAVRLSVLYDDLSSIVQRYQPDTVAIERLFVQKNLKTVIAVGQARGVVLLCSQQFGLSIAEYTPPQVKSAVCGTGRASKMQVQEMVARLLQLPTIPRPDDVADALAIAWCHANTQSFRNALPLS